MPLIECRQGSADVTVCGTTYQFAKDAHGRFVCLVEEPRALTCFLARPEMYRETTATPPAERVLWAGETLTRRERLALAAASTDEKDVPVSAALDDDIAERPRKPRKPRVPAGELDASDPAEAAATGGE